MQNLLSIAPNIKIPKKTTGCFLCLFVFHGLLANVSAQCSASRSWCASFEGAAHDPYGPYGACETCYPGKGKCRTNLAYDGCEVGLSPYFCLLCFCLFLSFYSHINSVTNRMPPSSPSSALFFAVLPNWVLSISNNIDQVQKLSNWILR